MPAFSSHYFFASDMMALFSDKLAPYGLDEEAVLLGAQGPDVFFFHGILPAPLGKSRRKIGSVLHRTKPSHIFDAMIAYIHQVKEKTVPLSYALGFLSHYALDTNCHPFVYGVQAVIQKRYPHVQGFTIHNTIESSLDNLLIHLRTGSVRPWEFDTFALTTFGEPLLLQIGKMLSAVISESIGETVSPREIAEAYRDMKIMQKVFHDGKGYGMQSVEFFENLLTPVRMGFRISCMMRPHNLEQSLKYGNLKRRIWRNPHCMEEKRTESYTELFEKSKGECAVLTEAFMDCLESGQSMAGATGERSFLTGVKL